MAPAVEEVATGPTGLPVLPALEVALGFPFGFYPTVREPVSGVPDPVRALRDALRPALSSTPCVVAFSGGRDSSLLLAVAADLAAREGRAPPTAVTFRYPGDENAEESSWQQLVVDHLRGRGLRFEWHCHDIDGELDVLGPLVGPILRAHGSPLWPPAVGSIAVLSDLARGGALISGNYGDEVLGGHRANMLRIAVHRRGRGLSRRAWAEILLAAAPPPGRRRILHARTEPIAWLRPAVNEERRRRTVAHIAPQPLRWDASLHHALGQRASIVGGQTLDTIAGGANCTLVQPLGAAGFVAALAAVGGRWGPGGRSAVVRMLAGDLLPVEVVTRTSKASFNASRFGLATAEFVRSWDGTGLDDELVDPDELRRAWAADVVPATAAMLLQAAWLHAGAR